MKKKPSPGDKILVFKEEWLKMIMSRKKTLEVRGQAFQSGTYWLGCKGKIKAQAILGRPCKIDSVEWAARQGEHRVPGSVLPYKKTYGLPVLYVKAIKKEIEYVHPRGAIGIVRFRQ